MKKIKIFNFVMSLFVICTLTGCGHEHEWADASCEAPKTCVSCGETEGEKLEHDWILASCETPKTCSSCGLTEGEAIGHKLTEANYQQGAICTVCNQEVGDPLPAEFAEHENLIHVKLDEEFDYETLCFQNENYSTVGKFIISDYKCFVSDEEQGLEVKEGYVWQSVNLHGEYSDENARKYGARQVVHDFSYYGAREAQNTFQENDEYDTFTENFNGNDYEIRVDVRTNKEAWENDVRLIVDYNVNVQVPIGFDGMLFGLLHRSVGQYTEEGQFLFDVEGGTNPSMVHLFRFPKAEL